MKKKLLMILTTILMICVISICFIACSGDNDSSNNDNRDAQIVAVYNMYVAHAESNGETPLSYEDWLASIKGETGEQGVQGPTGITPQLKVGEDNYWYVSYDNGTTWASLNVKATGETGATGAQGPQGAQGEQGIQGPTGITPQLKVGEDNYWYVSYDNGTTWASLNVKATGETGATGATGATGPQGPQGATGATGPQGPQGETGPQGPAGITPQLRVGEDNYWYVSYDNGTTWASLNVKATGETGATGAQGPQGEQGEQGIQGETGQNGLSAYEIFKKYYPEYTGTEQDWIYAVATNNVCALFGHKEIVDSAIEATCTTNGLTVGSHCEICGNVFVKQELVEAIGHDYATVTTEPTCTEQGYTLYCCHCEDFYIDNYVDALGHKEVINSAVAPTCNETGKTQGKYCSVCNEVLIAQETVEAIGHDFDNDTCLVCGEHQYFIFTMLDDQTYSIKAKNIDMIPKTLIIPSEFNGVEVTEISREAFAYCENIERLLIPESITKIYRYAFLDCSNISQIVYNAIQCKNTYDDMSVREIFYGAGSATDGICVVIGSNVKKIPPYLFGTDVETVGKKSSNIVALEFADKSVCEEIGMAAFIGCSKLKSVILPNSVSIIDIGAFLSCIALESIYIPVSVTNIPHQVFTNCKLTNVYYGGTREEWLEVSIGAWNDPLLSARKHYAATSDDYFDYTLLDDGTYSIRAKDVNDLPDEIILPSAYNGNSITKIDSFAFYNCTNLKNITIPDSILEISQYAFANCSNLVNINLREGLCVIGNDSFAGCVSLIGVHIPNSVYYIGGYAFERCTSLVSFSFSTNMTSIESRLFYGCVNLTDIKFGNNIQTICSSAFYGVNIENVFFDGTEEQWQEIYFENENDLLEDVTKHYKKEYIATPNEYFIFTLLDDGTYSVRIANIDNLPTEIVVPSTYMGISVTAIDEWGFSPIHGSVKYHYTSIIIPDTITSIGRAAFNNCSSLTSIIIPDGIKVIEQGTFQGCTNLKEIYVPYSVTSVHDIAFAGCNNLTEVYYDGTEIQWQDVTFGEWNYPFEDGSVNIYFNALVLC